MKNDQIVLDLMRRVLTLEQEVANLKTKVMDETSITTGGTKGKKGRDTTKYILEGKKYGKSRLVHAVVKKYVRDNPATSADELLSIFDKSLQGPIGVIRILDEVKASYPDYARRFFIKPNELIKTATKDCIVCNQWDIDNIEGFLTRTKEIGYNITIVK